MKVWIKNKWNNWINIDNLALYSLENKEKKNEINMCVKLQDINSSENLNLWWSGEKIEILCRLE
jgi:hypothetical protein